MVEITDAIIKKKHKEFNDRIKAVLEEVKGMEMGGTNPVVERLRQAIQNRQPIG